MPSRHRRFRRLVGNHHHEHVDPDSAAMARGRIDDLGSSWGERERRVDAGGGGADRTAGAERGDFRGGEGAVEIVFEGDWLH